MAALGGGIAYLKPVSQPIPHPFWAQRALDIFLKKDFPHPKIETPPAPGKDVRALNWNLYHVTVINSLGLPS